MKHVSVVDLFAGPGGLGEGFAAYRDSGPLRFKVRLSIEKDPHAHRTLELRSFFRQFRPKAVPEAYYRFLRGELSREQLLMSHPEQAFAARQEAWLHELGSPACDDRELDRRIEEAISRESLWVLIGGPPCQAYSLAGRSRNKGVKGYAAESDSRHFLYREYLRILATHGPAVFVMENVKGILSSRVNGQSIFERIIEDLQDPRSAVPAQRRGTTGSGEGYRIYSLVHASQGFDIFGTPLHAKQDFVIEGERFGIPQARHRVILLGVRRDIPIAPKTLSHHPSPVPVRDVLSGLPRLRGGLSREDDSRAAWLRIIRDVRNAPWIADAAKKGGREVVDLLLRTAIEARVPRAGGDGRGGEFIPCKAGIQYAPDWYIDERIKGVCNSTTRAHMTEDLHRYLYAACFASVRNRSPRLADFPVALQPDHRNVSKAMGHDNFSDRFRVQLENAPSTTIVSHVAKDGHYYIHYDPSQCRSLTVREVARLQTFPDNYHFSGVRTEQYTQVGNAVPPLLARQIAGIVCDLISRHLAQTRLASG